MELALIMTTAVSIVLAAAMGVVAWRLARAERLRSAARVAALAAGLRESESIGEQVVIGMRGEPARIHQIASRSIDFDTFESGSGRSPLPAGDIFQPGTFDRSRSRLAAVLAVGGFAVATSLALVIASSRGGPSVAEPTAVQTLTPGRPAGADAEPLELVALSHQRDGDRITIRGVVRTPRDGVRADQLTAVVYLFDPEGGLLGNGRAAIEGSALAPGTEAAFVVSVDHAGSVKRYRVSFRSGDRVVPHVDRRNSGQIGRQP
jgi:hypothetical protein